MRNLKHLQYILPLSKIKGNRDIIICFSPLSGISLIYKKFGKYIKNHDIYGIDYPFTTLPVDYFTTIHDMVQYYQADLSLLVEQYDNIYFLGYSFGGIIALEQSRLMHSLNINIKHLILVDTVFPSIFIQVANLGKIIQRLVHLINPTKLSITTDSLVEHIKHNYYLTTNYVPNQYSHKITLIAAGDHMSQSIEYWKKYVQQEMIIISDQEVNHYSILEDQNPKFIIQTLNKILNHRPLSLH